MSKREQFAEMMAEQAGKRIDALRRAGQDKKAMALEIQLLRTLAVLEK